MASRTVREEQTPQLPAGGSSVVVTGISSLDWSDAYFELVKKRKEDEELFTKLEERKQMLESLEQRIKELPKELRKTKLRLSFDMTLKDKDTDQAVEKAEKERKEVIEKEAEIERLKEEHAELKERKQELLHQVQRNSVYRDYMERVLKMTKFEDVQGLTGHLENLLHIRDQLLQKENEKEEQVDQQRKALLTLEDQHRLLLLHKNNQLSQLQTKLEKTRSEADFWERKWKDVQETAAKKTLLLGQIKMATLNLYESTGGEVEGEEGVDMNDTETQLDKIKIFIQDHNDIVRQLQTPSHRHSDGQKKDQKAKRPKKLIATHRKKH